MHRFAAFVVVAALPFAAAVGLRAAADIPAWAYAIAPPPVPGAPPPAPDTQLRTLPGTGKQFTAEQIRNPFGPVDWYPEDHPVMPEIVAKGKRPSARACGLCHMPNGKGRQENAAVSGLPVSYFIKTMEDFRNDLRKTADPRKTNTLAMAEIARAMTDAEIKETAEYFGKMKWTPWIRVVEATRVPKVRSAMGIWIPLEGAEAGQEPLGVRILETPEDPEGTEILRDPRSGFIAYVPVGSIKKGEALVKTGGNGKTVACGPCHGPDLMGLGPVPGIAGRSPSYMARQMYDMQVGARNGEWSQLMKPVVAKLTNEDLVNILAYVSSRPVGGTNAAK